MAGKILSQKNLNSLKKILSNTAKLLKDAGVDEESLTQLLIPEKKSEEKISAGFSEDLQDNLWRENFRSALSLAEEHFSHVALYGSHGSERSATKADLEQVVTEIIPVISQYLEGMPKYENLPEYALYCEALKKEEEGSQTSLAAGASEVFQMAFAQKAWRTSCDSAFTLFRRAVFDLMYSFVGTQAECVTQAKEILTELEKILQGMISTAPSLSKTVAAGNMPLAEPQREEILAASAAIQTPKLTEETIAISCSSVLIEASGHGYNKHPFSGILLRVDEISDSPPGIGPGNKLFVPMDVAKTAAAIINASGGLPLDVKDDLTGHNDINIFGVMTSAQIVDKDFHVSGHLFPVNKPEEVKAIAANKADLGMSINASARHHPEAIFNPDTNQEETVAYVDSLIPSGANILLSQLATWTQTKVLQAEGKKATSTPSVDAADSNPNNDENTMTNNNESDKGVDQIKDLLNGFLVKQEAGMNALQQSVDDLKAQANKQGETIAILKADKDEQDSLISAQKAEKQQQESDERLLKMVATVVKQTINPSNSPRSLTANYYEPLSAAAVDTPPEALPAPNDLQRELIAAQAQFDVLTENNVTGPARIKASDKLKRLQRQSSAR